MSSATELKGMAIAEIIEKYPATEQVFQSFGLAAYAKTRTAQFENLEASALVNSVDIHMLLQALTENLHA